MIVCKGLGSSLVVTKGYGRNYLSPFVKVRDFEKSVYKYIKENYADSHGFPLYYGAESVDITTQEIWLYCNFSELNVETGYFSTMYIDAITKIESIDSYNTQLSAIIEDLRGLFTNADIDLFDFTYATPQKVLDNKILIRDSGKPTYERVEELIFEGMRTLIQANQITIKLKLLKNFARSRAV